MAPSRNSTCVALLMSVLCGHALASDSADHAENPEHLATEHHKNKIEFGIANTHTQHGDNAFTLAVSYSYRFSEIASIGVLAEHAFDPLDFWVVGIPLKFYPGHGWVLTAMPGAEFHSGHQEALFRLGVGYEFEMEGYSITPEINADWVDDEVEIVVGVSLGLGF